METFPLVYDQALLRSIMPTIKFNVAFKFPYICFVHSQIKTEWPKLKRKQI